MGKTFLTFFFFLAGLRLIAQPVSDELPQITGCIALINAQVTTAPGKSPIVATVIMRDGLITHVGKHISIPPDAYRIEADSFHVYPAFIDAFSSVGIKENESDTGPSGGPGSRGQRMPVDEDGHPSLEDAGITPFARARATFDPKNKSIADWRAQGFALAHTVPKGKMIPGKGSVVVLSGKLADEMLWREDVSMFSQWTGAGGAYPATMIGVMAKWRELYYNAEQYVNHQGVYQNATLVSRPKFNQAHEALIPVVKKELPVYFRAPKVKDISRALEMQKELGMRMVIADAEEAWYLIDRFRHGNIPLVLSLDLPEDKSEKKEASKPSDGRSKDSTAVQSPKDMPDTREDEAGEEDAAPEVKDPEKEAFEKRRAESLKAHYSQAGVLAGEGIPFSFGTMSAKPGDFSKNIQLMKEHGLSFDQILSALTTQPAKLLGVEKYCGTLETGKMANVIVSSKPLFDKESAIRFMIVEGTLYEYEAKEKKKTTGESSPSAARALEGTWSYTIETPDQERKGTFIFTQSGGEIKGKINDSSDTSGGDDLENIVADEESASFTYDFDMGGQLITLEFDIKLSGETFDGSVSVGAFGTFRVQGNRTSKPN